MGTYKVYISYVIQKADTHVHASALVDFPLPKYSFYLDNSAQQVVQWAAARQEQFSDNEKIIILHFFNVADVK